MAKTQPDFYWTSLFLVVWLGGCMIPLPDKVSSGHMYTKDALAFLDLPGTTRKEVVETLGQPLLESTAARTLIYEWELTHRSLFVPPDKIGSVELGLKPETIKGDSYRLCLFIAFDDQSVVRAHAVRNVGTKNLEDACSEWQRGMGKKQ